MKQLIYIFNFLALTSIIKAQTVSVNIEWNNSIHTIPDYAYGVNSPANFIPAYSEDVIFMNNLELITQKKGLIRLHGWGMLLGDSPEEWQSNAVWDSNKINQALSPLIEQGYKVMINIPSGPLGEGDYQDPQTFAQFCADLVQIVNVDFGLNVEYWEIPNEREQGFEAPGLDVDQMATLINTAALAMKAVDPNIKVGGAATAWVNVDYLTQLTQITYPNIDFISCHTYSGDCTNTPENAYDIAQSAITDLALLRQNVNAITGSEYIPIFLTEYNVSFQGCSNIRSNIGAVYDAIILTGSVTSRIDASCYWAIAPYSDMSTVIGDQLDGNAFLYNVFNTYLYGELVESNSSDSSKIIQYATIDQDSDTYSFCLINRTSSQQTVQIEMTSLMPTALERHLWDENNDYTVESTNWTDLNDGNIVLSPYSVNIFVGELTSLIVPNGTGDKSIIFPNPNSGIVYVSNNQDLKSYMLFSSSGKLIKKGTIENGSINLSSVPSGIYYIKIFDKDGEINLTKGIVKK